jgi:non-specific serine/threonine protein kinase
VTLLAPGQIAARLDEWVPSGHGPRSGRFRLLTGGTRTALPRQQTLRASLDWSHDLLADPERTLLRRLAVFAGGFALDAAEAVGAGDGLDGGAVLDLLGQLVDKSLVLTEGAGGEARYRLLETVREYAAEHLAAAVETETARGRHRDWCLALAEEAAPALWGPEQSTWADRLEREHANLRVALGVCLDHEPELGLRLGAALWRFWQAHAHQTEGRGWLERLLAASPSPTLPRARSLLGAAILASDQRQRETQRALIEESIVLFRALGDQAGLGHALSVRGGEAMARGDHEAARRSMEESLAASRAVDDRPRLGWTTCQLGHLARREGDLERARSLYEESLTLFRGAGERMGIGVALGALGGLAERAGDTARARSLWEDALEVNREHGDRLGVGETLRTLGLLAWTDGDGARAAALLHESFALLWESAHPAEVAQGLYLCGARALQRGVTSPGVRLLGAAIALHPPLAAGPDPGGISGVTTTGGLTVDALLDAAHAALAQEAVAAAWAAGQALITARASAPGRRPTSRKPAGDTPRLSSRTPGRGAHVPLAVVWVSPLSGTPEPAAQ